MLKEKFLEFGYTEEEYNLIRNSYSVINYTEETFMQKFIEITSYLLDLGYTKTEVLKMTKTLPSIYGYSIENMNKKINDMISLGYTKDEVLKMIKSLPAIYSYSIENMNQKISDIIDLGYTREEVIKMTKVLPALYGYSIENIKQKINDVMILGYTKDEVLQMTKILPSILGLNIENIREKIEFYDSINMHELAVKDPKQLMQSVALSYARYMFYLSRGIEINMMNYSKLFMSNKRFEKTYGKTKQEILEEYNYEKYMEEKKNGRTL